MIIGNGWRIVHLTDRVVELRKDDWSYRRLTGRDGYVRVRAEPGMDRSTIIETAIETARKTDQDLSFRLAAEVFPTARGVGEYRQKSRALATMFGTPEDPEVIGAKSA